MQTVVISPALSFAGFLPAVRYLQAVVFASYFCCNGHIRKCSSIQLLKCTGDLPPTSSQKRCYGDITSRHTFSNVPPMTPPPVNPYEFPQTPPVSTGRWKTWSPFQSRAVRDICATMTDTEKSSLRRRGMVYGVWCAISMALPLQFISIGLVTGSLNPTLTVAGALLIVAHIVCIPTWQRRQRQFLCNTLWARANSIEPDALKLFNWRSNKDFT